MTVIEPGAIATELADHITHAGSKRVTLDEILVRPTAQAI